MDSDKSLGKNEFRKKYFGRKMHSEKMSFGIVESKKWAAMVSSLRKSEKLQKLKDLENHTTGGIFDFTPCRLVNFRNVVEMCHQNAEKYRY